MVLSCDGVGTKSKISQVWNKHDTIGIDLVAMVVNDIITTGAKPRYFMDYIGLEKLDTVLLQQLLTGIQNGCELAGCDVVGGETADMPGGFKESRSGLSYELAGFGVGFLECPTLSDEPIKAGDILLGLPSSGFHSNGYSLLRVIVVDNKY